MFSISVLEPNIMFNTTHRFFKLSTLLILFIGSASCSSDIEEINTSLPVEQIPTTPPDVNSVRYLAIGDSYTVGEGLDKEQSWPYQLKQKLLENGVEEVALTVIGGTGLTTIEVTRLIDVATFEEPFDIISIQIGVNNQYRGQGVEQFSSELNAMLEEIESNAYLKYAKRFAVSIPDWGATPYGKSYNRTQVAREINEYNALKKKACQGRSIPFINITELSRANPDNAAWVVQDGLHPSESMYAAWVEKIFPVVKPLIQS